MITARHRKQGCQIWERKKKVTSTETRSKTDSFQRVKRFVMPVSFCYTGQWLEGNNVFVFLSRFDTTSHLHKLSRLTSFIMARVSVVISYKDPKHDVAHFGRKLKSSPEFRKSGFLVHREMEKKLDKKDFSVEIVE